MSHPQLGHRQAPHAPGPQLWPGHPEHLAPPSERHHQPWLLPTLGLCLPPLQAAPMLQWGAALHKRQQCSAFSSAALFCICAAVALWQYPGAANLQQLHVYTTLHAKTGQQTGDNAQQPPELCACNPVGRCQYEVA